MPWNQEETVQVHLLVKGGLRIVHGWGGGVPIFWSIDTFEAGLAT